MGNLKGGATRTRQLNTHAIRAGLPAHRSARRGYPHSASTRRGYPHMMAPNGGATRTELCYPSFLFSINVSFCFFALPSRNSKPSVIDFCSIHARAIAFVR